MRRSLGVLALAVAVAAGCDRSSSPTATADPLVVLITVDAFRSDLASGGFARLAGGGTRYGHAWSVSAMSRPALATVMTGSAPDRTGVRSDVLDVLPEGLPTLASRFRDRGWTTAAIVGNQIASHVSGLDRGFELFDGPESLQVGPAAHAPTFVESKVLAERFASWLGSRPADRPAFVWLHLGDLHSAAPAVQAASDPMTDYQWTMERLDQGLDAIAGALASARGGDAAEVVLVGLYGVGTGDPYPAGAKYWLNDDTLRVTVLWKAGGASSVPLPPPDAELWLPDVPQILLARHGLAPFPDADGFAWIPGAGAPTRTIRAWNWALDDDLAWSTQSAVRHDGAWEVFEHERIAAPRDPEDSAALSAARERPATPRVRQLSENTRARLEALDIRTSPADVPGSRVVPEDRDAFLMDVLRVRRGLSFGNAIAARKTSRRLEEAAPDNVAVLSDIAYFASIGGAADEALARARRALELYPDREAAVHQAAHAEIARRDLERGEALLAAVRDLGGVEADVRYDEACVLALRGDVAGSVAALERAIQAGYRSWVNLEADLDLAAIRSDPSFAELLRRHGR